MQFMAEFTKAGSGRTNIATEWNRKHSKSGSLSPSDLALAVTEFFDQREREERERVEKERREREKEGGKRKRRHSMDDVMVGFKTLIRDLSANATHHKHAHTHHPNSTSTSPSPSPPPLSSFLLRLSHLHKSPHPFPLLYLHRSPAARTLSSMEAAATGIYHPSKQLPPSSQEAYLSSSLSLPPDEYFDSAMEDCLEDISVAAQLSELKQKHPESFVVLNVTSESLIDVDSRIKVMREVFRFLLYREDSSSLWNGKDLDTVMRKADHHIRSSPQTQGRSGLPLSQRLKNFDTFLSRVMERVEERREEEDGGSEREECRREIREFFLRELSGRQKGMDSLHPKANEMDKSHLLSKGDKTQALEMETMKGVADHSSHAVSSPHHPHGLERSHYNDPSDISADQWPPPSFLSRIFLYVFVIGLPVVFVVSILYLQKM